GWVGVCACSHTSALSRVPSRHPTPFTLFLVVCSPPDLLLLDSPFDFPVHFCLFYLPLLGQFNSKCLKVETKGRSKIKLKHEARKLQGKETLKTQLLRRRKPGGNEEFPEGLGGDRSCVSGQVTQTSILSGTVILTLKRHRAKLDGRLLHTGTMGEGVQDWRIETQSKVGSQLGKGPKSLKVQKGSHGKSVPFLPKNTLAFGLQDTWSDKMLDLESRFRCRLHVSVETDLPTCS
ncbi:hypothetical protein U0070_012037, partial [Myodes glareolus]